MSCRTFAHAWVLVFVALTTHGCGTAPAGAGPGDPEPISSGDSGFPDENPDSDAGLGDLGPAASDGGTTAPVGESKSFGEVSLSMSEPAGISAMFDTQADKLISAGKQKIFMLHFAEGLGASATSMRYGTGMRSTAEGPFAFSQLGTTAIRPTASGSYTTDPFALDLTTVLKSGSGMAATNAMLVVKDAVYTAQLSADGTKLENGTLTGWLPKADLVSFAIPALACVRIDCGSCGSVPKNAAELVECHGAKTDPSRTSDYHVVVSVDEGTVEVDLP